MSTLSPLAGKRIGLLSSWVSRRNGGVFEAVATQAKMLRRLGAQPVVIGVRDLASEEDLWRFEDAEIHLAAPQGPEAFAFAPTLLSLVEQARLDLLHLHGIWQFPSHVAGRFAQASGTPLIISPHGMLDPWITRRNAWKKHIGRIMWERRSWRAANAFHALTEAEACDIRQEAGDAQIAEIPNAAPPPSRIALRSQSQPRPPMALYLGRIHEKKNLTALIKAWLSVHRKLPPNAMLTIAGWGDDAGIFALERAMPADEKANIKFLGATFGSQKAALFDVARFLVLPSHSEGLPMAVLEAWSTGVPTLMSKHCHLPQGFAAGAARDCGTSQDTIARTLLDAFSMGEAEWQAMSRAARELATGPFSQIEIAQHWEGFYTKLL